MVSWWFNFVIPTSWIMYHEFNTVSQPH
jgi:hypothetical protein